MAMAAYSSFSILGPLLIIGGLGLYLDKIFNTKPWLLIISVFIAFIITNILLFKKVMALNKMIKEQNKNINKSNSQST